MNQAYSHFRARARAYPALSCWAIFVLLLIAQPAWAQLQLQVTPTGVTVSSPQFGDTFSEGDQISVRVSFANSARANMDHPPGLTIRIGATTTRTAAFQRSGVLDGAYAVDFSYTVQLSDASSSGISVVEIKPDATTDTSFQLWEVGLGYVSITQDIVINANFPNYQVQSIAYGGDGFIDVETTHQLNAIRWDLDGDGVAQGDMGSYRAAFPNLARNAGCPSGGCSGYELTRNLDLAGVTMTPIGTAGTPFAAHFRGNGYTISGLSMLQADDDNVGLFGVNAGTVSELGLVAPSVTGNANVGALIGQNEASGIVSASFATELSVAGTSTVGGLVGANAGAIVASYATGSVMGTSNTSSAIGGLAGDTTRRNSGKIVASFAAVSVSGYHVVGGLVGRLRSHTRVTATYATGAVNGATRRIGGLVGRMGNGARVHASYARNPVSGDSEVGGLVGSAHAGGRVSDSYWDTNISMPTTSSGGLGKTTSELQSPTRYGTGIYSTWNSDLDDDGNDDDPWDFGTPTQYPVLSYGGLKPAFQRQLPLPPPLPTQPAISVDTSVFLQGAYDRASGAMKTTLIDLLPTRQPYNVAPWGYRLNTNLSGLLNNAAFGLSGVTQTVVDWVLVELRATSLSIATALPVATMVDRRAALLLSDGNVVSIDPNAATAPAAIATGNVVFRGSYDVNQDLYVLIHHRNHLSVITTATSGAGCGADYCADFTRRQSWQDGQHDAGDGSFLMFAGDTDSDGDVDEDDTSIIRRHNTAAISGGAQYTAAADGRYVVDGDLDLDGDVLSKDRYFILINDDARTCDVCSPSP